MASASPVEQQQVEDEAGILSRYSTQFPFIPNIYDIWSDNLRTYMVMEYIDGQTLEAALVQPWPSTRVEEFLRTMLDYLSQLHSAGIIHRDIKPANIISTPQGRYVLLDFGIAKQGTTTRTMLRQIGSPMYTPIEQFQGRPADPRSDLYSLAATAYHLLTGQPPASADARQLGASLMSPHTMASSISPSLEYTLMRMLALEQSTRPANAQAALKLLLTPPSRISTTRRVISENRTKILIALITSICSVVVAVVPLLAAHGSSENDPAPTPVYPTAPPNPTTALPTSAPRPTAVLPSSAPRPTAAESEIDLSGTWQGAGGLSYKVVQYGDAVAIEEIHPSYGVTAQGKGVITGQVVAIAYAAADGTVGRAILKISSDGRNLTGVFQNLSTGVSVRAALYR